LDNDEKYININEGIKQILIVDDLTYVVRTIERILTEAGYLVLTAKTGMEALELFETHTPDLITVDQKLPDMLGTKLVEKIRSIEKGKKIKIIFISAVYETDEILSILKLKVDDFLIKPFQKSKLLESVKNVLFGKSNPEKDETEESNECDNKLS